jgi:hypothetical protein
MKPAGALLAGFHLQGQTRFALAISGFMVLAV